MSHDDDHDHNDIAGESMYVCMYLRYIYSSRYECMVGRYVYRVYLQYPQRVPPDKPRLLLVKLK